MNHIILNLIIQNMFHFQGACNFEEKNAPVNSIRLS